MDKYYIKIYDKITSSNKSKKIKIRIRSYSTNHYSLYLEYSKNGKKHREYLKRFICGTKESTNTDNETLRFVSAYRDTKEKELLLDDTGFILKKNDYQKACFLEYFKTLTNKKKGSTQSKWQTVLNHLIKFTNNKCTIEDVNETFCRRFYEYLDSIGKNSTPKVYFKVFSTALNHLFLYEVISINPTKKILLHPDIKKKLNANKYKKKEFLNIEEVKQLINNPIKNKQVMNAFLFSCFTGLRFEDIKTLRFCNIKDNYLYIRQLKTEEDTRMKLTETAQKIITEQKVLCGIQSEYVFNLSDNKVTNKYLKRWIKEAKIEKK